MIHGSVPGPTKRLIRFRDPSRYSGVDVGEVEMTYISTASKQGT